MFNIWKFQTIATVLKLKHGYLYGCLKNIQNFIYSDIKYPKNFINDENTSILFLMQSDIHVIINFK